MMDGETVLPGDWISLPQSCRIGPGLYNEPAASDESAEEGDVRACVAGVLRKREIVQSKTKPKAALEGDGESPRKKTAWVDYSSRRYVPMKGDRVLGVVTKTTGRSYRIDIGSAVSAFLPELSFEGATKRNKPNLQVGEVVYARVSRCHKDMEPELSCVDGTTGKASGLGQLPIEGNLIRCSTGLCRKLLSSSCTVREALGNYFKFELTIGLNGRVWVNSSSLVHTIAISKALVDCQWKSDEQCREMVDDIVERL